MSTAHIDKIKLRKRLPDDRFGFENTAGAWFFATIEQLEEMLEDAIEASDGTYVRHIKIRSGE